MNSLALPDELVESLSPDDLAQLLEELTLPRTISIAQPQPYRPPRIMTMADLEGDPSVSHSWGMGRRLDAIDSESRQDQTGLPNPRNRSIEPPSIPATEMTILDGIQHFKDLAPKGQYSALVELLPFQTITWSTGPLKRLACRISSDEFGRYPLLQEIIRRSLQALPSWSSRVVTGAWINLYRDGQDYTPHHQDSYEADVLTISIGATRRFLTKDKAAPGQKVARAKAWSCEDGDIIIFTPEWNATHTHSVPKTTLPVGPRISIVLFLN